MLGRDMRGGGFPRFYLATRCSALATGDPRFPAAARHYSMKQIIANNRVAFVVSS